MGAPFLPGDTVVLSGETILVLAETYPLVFEQLRKSKCAVGHVVTCGEDSVTIDMDVGLANHIVVSFDPRHPYDAVELLSSEDDDLDDVRHGDDDDGHDDGAHGKSVAVTVTPGGFEVHSNGNPMRVRTMGFPAQPSEYGAITSGQVSLAQWAVYNFLGLKQSVLSHAAAAAKRHSLDDLDGEDWKKPVDPEISLAAPMTVSETAVYNTALTVLRHAMLGKIPDPCAEDLAKIKNKSTP